MSKVDLKVVMLGDRAVGKTSLMERYVHERFNESMAYQNTIGVAFAAKEIKMENEKIILGIWDTAGSERYNSMAKIYYRGAKSAIICYEITNKESFNRAKYWIRELKSQEESCKIYLCATKHDIVKTDQQPMPNLDIVRNYADGIGAKFFITSSKTGENVVELFEEIAKDFLMDPTNRIHHNESLNLSTQQQNNISCCFYRHRS